MIQCQYTGWPDHGIPTTTSSIIKLRKIANEECAANPNKGPIIVHCRSLEALINLFVNIEQREKHSICN